jgi:hypothetical protein
VGVDPVLDHIDRQSLQAACSSRRLNDDIWTGVQRGSSSVPAQAAERAVQAAAAVGHYSQPPPGVDLTTRAGQRTDRSRQIVRAFFRTHARVRMEGEHGPDWGHLSRLEDRCQGYLAEVADFCPEDGLEHAAPEAAPETFPYTADDDRIMGERRAVFLRCCGRWCCLRSVRGLGEQACVCFGD